MSRSYGAGERGEAGGRKRHGECSGRAAVQSRSNKVEAGSARDEGCVDQ